MQNSTSNGAGPVLSKTAEYAVRAVLLLAHHYGERTVTGDEVAESIGAPRNYLAKTLHALAKAGIVTGMRGPQGGFTLAVPPTALSVARVIDAFDEPRPSTQCLLGRTACNPAAPCIAHRRWSAIGSAIRAPLASTTIADLLGTSLPTPMAVTPGSVPAAAAVTS